MVKVVSADRTLTSGGCRLEQLDESSEDLGPGCTAMDGPYLSCSDFDRAWHGVGGYEGSLDEFHFR